jgi:galactokinase
MTGGGFGSSTINLIPTDILDEYKTYLEKIIMLSLRLNLCFMFQKLVVVLVNYNTKII